MHFPVMLQSGKDSYQGIASAMPPSATILDGFQPLGFARHCTAAKAFALRLLLVACLKACPDTSLSLQTAPLANFREPKIKEGVPKNSLC